MFLQWNNLSAEKQNILQLTPFRPFSIDLAQTSFTKNQRRISHSYFQIESGFYFYLLWLKPPLPQTSGELTNSSVLCSRSSRPNSSHQCGKPKQTYETLSRRLAGQQLLHHFWMILPQHIRARSPLNNPVGGLLAATHKQANPPHPKGTLLWNLRASLSPQSICGVATTSWATAFALGETNCVDLEAQNSDSYTVK